MCLVSYVPLTNGFVLSSNRDESPMRAVKNISTQELGSRTIHFPTDSSGGSWIFHSDRSEVICLLNGAFVNHKRVLPYRMSRGIVMRSFFEYETATNYLSKFSFTGIEPFTMIINTPEGFYEFRWDGLKKHILNLDRTKVHVWSSCTLYTPEIVDKREEDFNTMLNGRDKLDPNEVKEIHLTADPNDMANGFIMNRSNIVATISLTQIIKTANAIEMNHMNLEA